MICNVLLLRISWQKLLGREKETPKASEVYSTLQTPLTHTLQGYAGTREAPGFLFVPKSQWASREKGSQHPRVCVSSEGNALAFWAVTQGRVHPWLSRQV